jgi:hypothetical protein
MKDQPVSRPLNLRDIHESNRAKSDAHTSTGIRDLDRRVRATQNRVRRVPRSL